MIALIKSATLLNRLCLATQTQLVSHLSTVRITVDGKPIGIEELPKKPKQLNLFDKYCKDLGVSGEELRSQRAQLLQAFNENKKSFETKNKKLIEAYRRESKAYNETFEKTVKLRDVRELIKFYQKQLEKEAREAEKKANKKPRKPSFWAFFIKQAISEGQSRDLSELSTKFKSLSSSQVDHYKQLYEEYLRKNF